MLVREPIYVELARHIRDRPDLFETQTGRKKLIRWLVKQLKPSYPGLCYDDLIRYPSDLIKSHPHPRLPAKALNVNGFVLYGLFNAIDPQWLEKHGIQPPAQSASSSAPYAADAPNTVDEDILNLSALSGNSVKWEQGHRKRRAPSNDFELYGSTTQKRREDSPATAGLRPPLAMEASPPPSPETEPSPMVPPDFFQPLNIPDDRNGSFFSSHTLRDDVASLSPQPTGRLPPVSSSKPAESCNSRPCETHARDTSSSAIERDYRKFLAIGLQNLVRRHDLEDDIKRDEDARVAYKAMMHPSIWGDERIFDVYYHDVEDWYDKALQQRLTR